MEKYIEKYLNKPFGELVKAFIKKDTLFNANNDDIKLYTEWYIIIDGAGGVNCVLFRFIDEKLHTFGSGHIQESKYIGKFTCQQISQMSIHYESWFENQSFLKTFEDVINEVYEYVKCTRES